MSTLDGEGRFTKTDGSSMDVTTREGEDPKKLRMSYQNAECSLNAPVRKRLRLGFNSWVAAGELGSCILVKTGKYIITRLNQIVGLN